MKYFIYSICIPACFYVLVFSSCRQRKKKGIVDTHQQKLIEKKNIPDTILLVTMAFGETNLIEPIKNKVASFYHIPVKQIQVPLPAFAYFRQRNRYRADSLLNYLAALNNDRYRFVAGLTSKDISCTQGANPDWGIFGLGSFSGNGCVTSSFRLKRNASISLLTERIQKVVLHEIGHNYKLEHCTSLYPCFMQAADGKISKVDSEPMEMCKLCRKKVLL